LTNLVKESTSQPDLLRRTAVVAAWTGIVLGLAVAWRWGWTAGTGFVLALGWSLANFAVLAAILKTATHPEGVRVGRLALWIVLKLVGLYGLAIWVLVHRWFPLAAFAAGFSWPLAVGFLRAVGSLVVRTGPRRETARR
jgi:hypothetical protein